MKGFLFFEILKIIILTISIPIIKKIDIISKTSTLLKKLGSIVENIKYPQSKLVPELPRNNLFLRLKNSKIIKVIKIDKSIELKLPLSIKNFKNIIPNAENKITRPLIPSAMFIATYRSNIHKNVINTFNLPK